MTKQKSRRRLTLNLAAVVGLTAMVLGIYIGSWRDLQSESFNHGLAAYLNGDFETAVIEFDRSIYEYEQRLSGESMLEKLLLPAPDRGLAARAAIQKAMAYAALEQFELAADALRQSLEINPGNDVDAALAPQLEEEALIAKYDLEILLRNHPESNQSEESQNGDERKDQPPGDQPGDQPGDGSGDDY